MSGSFASHFNQVAQVCMPTSSPLLWLRFLQCDCVEMRGWPLRVCVLSTGFLFRFFSFLMIRKIFFGLRSRFCFPVPADNSTAWNWCLTSLVPWHSRNRWRWGASISMKGTKRSRLPYTQVEEKALRERMEYDKRTRADCQYLLLSFHRFLSCMN